MVVTTIRNSHTSRSRKILGVVPPLTQTTTTTTSRHDDNNNNNNDTTTTTTATTITTKDAPEQIVSVEGTTDARSEVVVIDALWNILCCTSAATTMTNDDDDNDDERTTRNTNHHANVRTFLNVFCAACSNRHVPMPLVPLDTRVGSLHNTTTNHRFSMKDQHQSIYTALRNSSRNSSGQHRRSSSSHCKIKEVFQSLHHLIQYVIHQYCTFLPTTGTLDENDDDDDNSNNNGTATDIYRHQQLQQPQTEGFLFIHYATRCVMAYVEGTQTTNTDHMLEDLFPMAVTLHDFLDTINDLTTTTVIDNDDDNVIQTTFDTIIALCETWWLHNGYHKESLIHNALPTLVGNVVSPLHHSDITTTTSGTSASTTTAMAKHHIQRLYQLRTALSIIDYDDADSQSFISLLVRITSSPTCITHTDGKRLIAYLLSDPEFYTTSTTSSLRHLIHQSIRVQIPNNKKSIVVHYSDIYYMAWKELCSSSNNTSLPDDRATQHNARDLFEMELLSDYVYASIYVEQPSVLQSIHLFLSKWYDVKHNGADTLHMQQQRQQFIHRMYTPILWRATVAPNPQVRINAIQILYHLFPSLVATTIGSDHQKHRSTKPDSKNNSSHHHHHNTNKICSTIQQLLHDPDGAVRVTTSNVTSQLLLHYWDGIPTIQIHSFLNCIVSEHASDVSSSAVRVGAVNAITQLLNAPQSHGVLREVLPAIGNLIHDRVEKVRLAVVQMLLRIKTIPNIKYYHIVPLEHLTARFIEEAKVHQRRRHPSKSLVASALTSLMINSYFPDKNQTSSDASVATTSRGSLSDNTEPIRRALQFCTDEPEAAIVFYAHVSKYRSFTSIVQLLIQLFQYLYTSSVDQDNHRSSTTTTSAAVTKRRRLRIGKAQAVVDTLKPSQSSSMVNDKEDLLPSPPIEVLATIAEVIRTLWESIATKLQQNDEWNTFLMDEFSGPKLTTIFTYYDNLAHTLSASSTTNDDVDNDTESLLIQEDCCRICTNIVSCAGRLPLASAGGLVSAIFTSIQRDAEPHGVDYNTTHTDLITSYIAITLRNWNMTEQIISSLTTTIRSSLYQNLTDDSNCSFLGSPLTMTGNSKKRRSGRAIPSSKSINDTADSTTLPPLPVPIIVRLLDDILTGSGPDCALARDAILSSTKTSDDLEQLFHDGIKYMEHILDPIESHRVSTTESSKILDLVSICELHGRFALHKEASRSNDGSVLFNDEAKHLLFLASNTIVPAFQRLLKTESSSSGKALPFSDPNISTIQLERSFVDTTLASPQSPIVLSRPRRRANLNQTPQRLDGGLGIYQDFPDDDRVSVTKIQQAVVGPLFVSICKLFSEWLVVNSSVETANFIGLGVIEWCQLLSSEIDEDDTSLVDIYGKVQAAFYHLMCQLILTSENAGIMKEVFSKMRDDTKNLDLLQNALSSVLIPKVKTTLLSNELVTCFFDVTYDFLTEECVTKHSELPDSCEDDWSIPKRSLATLLTALMSCQKTCTDLANGVIKRFSVHVKEPSHNLLAFFDVQCMWLLACDTNCCKISPNVVESIIQTVQQVNLTDIHDEGLKMLIDDFKSKL